MKQLKILSKTWEVELKQRRLHALSFSVHIMKCHTGNDWKGQGRRHIFARSRTVFYCKLYIPSGFFLDGLKTRQIIIIKLNSNKVIGNVRKGPILLLFPLIPMRQMNMIILN